MRSDSLTLTARYVFPVEGAPIHNGWVSVIDGAISRVGRSHGVRPDFDLGNVAILPGFVNAHTHLDLAPIEPEADRPDGTEDEIRWLRRVVDRRRRTMPDESRRTVATNIDASLAAGTTAIADISPAGQSWNAVADSPLRGIVFAEILGLRRGRGLQTNQDAWEWIGSLGIEEDAPIRRLRPGLSPHAPYSTAGWLYERASAGKMPLSTHLAEMPEERLLLETRGGPLRSFLEEIGAWDDDGGPLGPSPADYLRRGELKQSDWLVAHGTYLRPDEFWGLRPTGEEGDRRVAVAYCPRTHARFGQAPHPYRAMLERGVIVCLGTDGLASSPTLSVLDEVRFLHQRDPSLSGPLLVTMATLFGAWALRIDDIAGSIAPRKRADFAIVALPDREEDDPHRLLLDSDLPVIGTMSDGEFVWGKWTNR
jgi:cytosine/adenosine deaminase-related metal-dependent hydrolase